jgi:hypothetical protein
MSQADGQNRVAEVQRQAVFRALVEAQDNGTPVGQSRVLVAQQFGVDVLQVLDIEREGLDKSWPPLEQA